MAKIFNPRTILLCAGVVIALMGGIMVFMAATISESAFPGTSEQTLEVATWMHQIFGATSFSFGFLVFNAAFRNTVDACKPIAMIVSVAFLPVVCVAVYHATGPVPAVVGGATFNVVLWLIIGLSGLMHTSTESNTSVAPAE